MAAELDPGAERMMAMASAILRSRDENKRLKRQLWALMAVLRLEQQRSAALCDLVDVLLDGEPGGHLVHRPGRRGEQLGRGRRADQVAARWLS